MVAGEARRDREARHQPGQDRVLAAVQHQGEAGGRGEAAGTYGGRGGIDGGADEAGVREGERINSAFFKSTMGYNAIQYMKHDVRTGVDT